MSSCSIGDVVLVAGAAAAEEEAAASRRDPYLRRCAVSSCAEQMLLLAPPLQYLQIIAKALGPYGQQAMFYLAAAVSDFYIPWSQLVRQVALHTEQ